MLKLVVMALVVVFMTMAGIVRGESFSLKAQAYSKVCALLEHFRFLLGYGYTVDRIAEKFGDEMQNRGDLISCFEKMPLDKGHKNELIYLFENMGRSTDVSLEISKCKEAFEKFKKISADVMEDSKRKKELYSKLGVIAGVAICVLIA